MVIYLINIDLNNNLKKKENYKFPCSIDYFDNATKHLCKPLYLWRGGNMAVIIEADFIVGLTVRNKIAINNLLHEEEKDVTFTIQECLENARDM